MKQPRYCATDRDDCEQVDNMNHEKPVTVFEREKVEENGNILLSIKRKLKTELSLQSDPFKKLRGAVRFIL